MKIVRNFALLALLALSAIAASADTITYNLAWSGASNGNTATATGQITIDTSLIPNPGSYFGNTPAWVTGLTLTVSGSASGNGTFGLSDFSSLYWDTNGATLNLAQSLIGQPTSGSPWGTTNDGASGDFNLFGASPTAPSGTFFFQLTTSGGDTMNLTSFAPAALSVVPEPASLSLMGLGAVGIFGVSQRKRLL